MPKHIPVNYDQLAPTYNQRFADDDTASIADVLLALAQELNAERVLEAGCGTGRWLAEFSQSREQAYQSYGLDLSAGMLAEARRKNAPFQLARGRAEELPYSNASFDLVYCVNAIHHFEDGSQFIHSARRLLREGGCLAVIGMDPRRQAGKWYVYDYFSGAYQTDLERFPSWGEVLDWAASAGFIHAELAPVQTIFDPKVGWDVLQDPFLEKHSCSQLALLSEAVYTAGIESIKSALIQSENRGETLIFPNTLHLHMLRARV